MLRFVSILLALTSLLGPPAGAASRVTDAEEAQSTAEAFETEARFLVHRVMVGICQDLDGYCLDVRTESTVDAKIIRGLFGERFLGMVIHLRGDRGHWTLPELRILAERLSEKYLGLDKDVSGFRIDEKIRKVWIFVVDEVAKARLAGEFGALPVVLKASGRLMLSE